MADSVLSIGLQGVQNGLANANQAAKDILAATTTNSTAADSTATNSATAGSTVASGNSNRSSGDGLTDITTAAVELKMSEHQVKASTAVIKTADEMMGTLIDIKA